MKKMIKTLLCTIMAAALSLSFSVTAFAERTEDYSRQEIIDKIWTKNWDDSLPGELNAEGSLWYHILEQFLDEQYGHVKIVGDSSTKQYLVRDWKDFDEIIDAWGKYRVEYTKLWDFDDNEDTGEFTINQIDPDTGEVIGLLYTFEFKDGKWNMLDTDGNVVDSFDPHGGDGSRYKDDSSLPPIAVTTDTESSTVEHQDAPDTPEIVDTPDTPSVETPASSNANADSKKTDSQLSEKTDKEDETDSQSSEVTDSEDNETSSLPFIIGGAGFIVVATAAGLIVSKKRGK